MKALTDYPLIDIGDVPNKPAPLREVEVVAYNGDKYCEVHYRNVVEYIKAGYIYELEHGSKMIPVSRNVLEKLPHPDF